MTFDIYLGGGLSSPILLGDARLQLHIIPSDDILIKTNRQRRDLNQTKILELAASISEVGIIHPVVVRSADDEFTLVAGERRIKALEHLWFLGTPVMCGGREVPEGCVPCLYLGEIDPIDAEEIELEENIRREDLNWRERADAISRLADLRVRQAQLSGEALPTVADIARELKPEATEGKADGELGAAQGDVREDILLGVALRDPTKAAAISGATSKKEAVKLLKRHEEATRHAELSRTLGSTFNVGMHQLLKGDCLSVLATLPDASFDVILTDPPYGIGADEFGDSGGKAASHGYDDSPERLQDLSLRCAEEFWRITKPAAHLYWFCDIEHFLSLRKAFSARGFDVFRTPLLWVNPTAMRAPWPERGPQRKYQLILYATRGSRPVTRLYSDVLTHPSDQNLGWAAQKPVALYSDLIRRSVRPGDTICDPFCGTGTIFPAAHEHQCRATGIELDDAAFGIAAKRLEGLK